ncbi:MAG: TolC family protein, partial [Chitinispirillaceae bacterium]|nr:TolC family protein [Chitinispirillaceae bacterium]
MLSRMAESVGRGWASRFFVTGIVFLAAWFPIFAGQSTIAHTLSGYLLWAVEHNPEVTAARASAEAKGKEFRLATKIPDPQLSGGYFISPVETRVGPQKGRVGASQMIPWPGKLIERRIQVEHEREAVRQKLRAAQAGVFFNIRASYANLFAIGREMAITRENYALLKHMESVLLAKYATATATQISVLKIQVEMAVLEDALADLGAEASKTRSTLARLLDLKGMTDSIPFPPSLPRLGVPVDTAGTFTGADSLNPELNESDANVKAARAGVALARRSFAPDFMVMTDYIITGPSSSSMVSPKENGKNPWIIGGSITLPLWIGSKTAALGRARAMESMQDALFANRKNMLDEKAVHLTEGYNDARRRIALYEKTLIPKARQTFELVSESYINSTATVLDYLDAQRVLLKLEVMLVRQRARRESIAGAIDELLGGDLTRGEIGTEW